MPRFQFNLPIGQLEKRKGGYYYFPINAEVVARFEKKRATRLICEIDEKVSYGCGLNHLGDGNFFIILSGKNLKKLDKALGDEVTIEIFEDPNPLGVAVPEVLQTLLDQDEQAKSTFDRITDGKKRSLIYSLQRIKDIDKQVQTSLKFFQEQDLILKRKART